MDYLGETAGLLNEQNDPINPVLMELIEEEQLQMIHADIICDIFGIDTEYLMHVGVGHDRGGHSGRFPWGSGKDPLQRYSSFLDRYNDLKNNKHMSDGEIADEIFEGKKNHVGQPLTTDLRAMVTIAKNQVHMAEVHRAEKMKADGYSLRAIGRELGRSDSTIREWFKEKDDIRKQDAMATAEILKKQIDEKGVLNVGGAAALALGVSETNLKTALVILEDQGYVQTGGRVPQLTNPGKQTTIRVIGPPGTPKNAAYQFDQIHSIDEVEAYSHDKGETFTPSFRYPESMNSKRLAIRYAGQQGGEKQDGVMEIRPGVPDLYLGNGTHYAQVRILVDGDRYLKGMAVYGKEKDFPPGVDVIFNTNKKEGTPMRDVLKSTEDNLKKDPKNPFGSLIAKNGQSDYTDPKTGETKMSLINKRASEGDWNEWSTTLPSQFLGKQNMALINRQLGETKSRHMAQYEEIMSLTNGTLKKDMLMNFAQTLDSAAVHLKAAGLPGQRYHVILPLTDIPEHQVYAPNYNNGEKVALVRFPHGDISEIPILTVNNNIASGKHRIGPQSKDAIGISHLTAERLSGADFDGDTVIAIPIKQGYSVSNRPRLEGMKGFDSKDYAGLKTTDANGNTIYTRNGVKYPLMKKGSVQREMGQISNLLTDMAVHGAPPEHVERALKHSMVVIDAYKHKLDYKQSAIDNNISELVSLYQRKYNEDGSIHIGGASTLLSQATSKEYVTKRKGSPRINPEDGSLIYKESYETYTDKKGNTKIRQQQVAKMANRDDPYSLISSANTVQERAYADYAKFCKDLANKARLDYKATTERKYDKASAAKYSEEIASMNEKLFKSKMNQSKELEAQLKANAEYKKRIEILSDECPEQLTKEEKKKLQNRLLKDARDEVGSHRQQIAITDKEWEAIQNGAFHPTTVHEIIRYAGTDTVAKLAMPKTYEPVPDGKVSRMKAMRDNGKTTAEIASALGVSTSTVWRCLDEGVA